MDAALPGQVAAAVLQAPPQLAERELLAHLRSGFADVRLVVCNDDDVSPRAKAAAGNARCNLYYLDASEHCVALSNDAETACGLVIGLIDDAAA